VVLSGDSLIVKFDPNQGCSPVRIISLEHLIAPKLGSPDGTIPDEPYGFDSWNFIRNLCIGARVGVLAPSKPSDMTRSHPAYGRLPLFFSFVTILQFPERAVGLTCVRAGWIRIRAPRIMDLYVQSLFAGEAEARAGRLGIWVGQGTVRRLPVLFNPRDLLSIGIFDGIVDSVVNGTTISLFLIPNHEHIIFRVAACRSPSAKKDQVAEFGLEAKEFTINNLLNRSIRVRLCSCNESDLFIGPIIDQSDGCIRELLARGLAQYNVHTADLTPSAAEYERCEASAKANRLRIWSAEPVCDQPLMAFDGTVHQVIGSQTLRVDVHGDSRIIELSCVRTADFVPGGGSDPFGFETRERLRRLLIGQVVSVVVDGLSEKRYYATVSLADICVNVLLCREGLARVIDPVIGKTSDRIGEMRDGEQQAQAERVGMFSAVPGSAPLVNDLSITIYPDKAMRQLERLRGEAMVGVIEQILGGNRFVVLVPTKLLMLRLAVNGLLPISPSDPHGRQATLYCLRKYLNRDVEFGVHEVDKSGGFLANMTVLSPNGGRVDIARDLLSEGLAEVHKRTVKGIANFDELVAVQEAAKEMEMGKWSKEKYDELQLEFDHFYPVKVVEVVNTTTLIVQLLQAAMKEIFTLLPSAMSPLEGDVTPSELVCVLIDTQRYRARVERVVDAANIHALLVDFNIRVQVQRDAVYELPMRLLCIEPQAVTVRIAFLKDTTNAERDREFVVAVTKDVAMFMNVVYATELSAVFLFDRPALDAGSLNAVLLQNTALELDGIDINLDDHYMPLVHRLQVIASARKAAA
jgi:staphylococcal nuclease domain-containing protein 1